MGTPAQIDRRRISGTGRCALVVLCLLVPWRANTAWPAESAPENLNATCAPCHQLSAHIADWNESVHMRAGITCGRCHTRGREQTAGAPALAGDRSTPCPDDHQGVLAICGLCHQEVAQAFRESAHFREASNGQKPPTCVDCHSAAGGSILSDSLIPQRCATCHRTTGGAGTPGVTEKAPELLQLLRRVTLARTVVSQRLDMVRRTGDDTRGLETELDRVDASFRGIPLEWHQFNLQDVERRSQYALRILESLHDRLELRPAPGTTPPSVSDVPAAADTPRGRPLRFAVASIINPIATYEGYRGLFEDLGHTLGQPYEFVQRRTYGEVNELLLQGELDLAFICSGGYAALPRDAPIEILALPVVHGRSAYHSLIIVRTRSPIQRFEDLEGVRFAFTDPLSTTGHLYPVFRATQLGKDPRNFFGSTLFSGSHDRSIQAVHHGLVDAAAVNELVYHRVVVPGNEYWDQLRVIESSPDFGMPPVVAPTSVPAAVRTRMREFLLGLANTPEGRERLAALGVDRFTLGGSESYEFIREIREATGATSR